MGQYTKKCHLQLKLGNSTISNTLNRKTTNIIKVLSSSISFVICNCFCNPTQKIALNNWMWYRTRITGNKKGLCNKKVAIFTTNIFTSYSVISLGSQVGELFWCHARALRLTSPWWRSWGRSRTILGCIADSWLKTTCILRKLLNIVGYFQLFVIDAKWNFSSYHSNKDTPRTYATFPKLFGINRGREV